MSTVTSADGLESTTTTEAARSRSNCARAAPIPDAPPTTAMHSPSTLRSAIAVLDSARPGCAEKLDDGRCECGVTLEHDPAASAGLRREALVAPAQIEDRLSAADPIPRVDRCVHRRHQVWLERP